MTVKTKSTRNYIDLISLKASKMLEKQNFDIILNDDIWDNNTLIVKSGGYLTDSLINKLINFGIEEVSVDFAEKAVKPQDINLFKLFINDRNVLIVDNNLHQISWLVKNLVNYGFDKAGISITDNYNYINKIFRAKKISLIFTSSYFYEKCGKCIDKYSLLRNTHAFVIMEQNETARKLKSGYNSEVKFIRKPLNTEMLKFFINQPLGRSFLDFYTEESSIS